MVAIGVLVQQRLCHCCWVFTYHSKVTLSWFMSAQINHAFWWCNDNCCFQGPAAADKHTGHAHVSASPRFLLWFFFFMCVSDLTRIPLTPCRKPSARRPPHTALAVSDQQTPVVHWWGLIGSMPPPCHCGVWKCLGLFITINKSMTYTIT